MAIKTECSRCNEPIEDHRLGKYRYCLKCHAKNMRDKRPKYKDLSIEQKKKIRIRSLSNMRQRRGILETEPCKHCGSGKNIEKHHHEYANDAPVVFLCRKCHIRLHKGDKEVLRTAELEQDVCAALNRRYSEQNNIKKIEDHQP